MRNTLVALVCVALTAVACGAVNSINTNRDGFALRGYDPVAYFTEGKPLPGTTEFTHSWGGAKWQFASARNRDLFAADPGKYAPQYGGYCAYAVSRGYTYDADPLHWKIVNDKLYVNFNAEAQQLWEKDASGHIAKADEHWPKLKEAK
jgi:hypothetical protein